MQSVLSANHQNVGVVIGTTYQRGRSSAATPSNLFRSYDDLRVLWKRISKAVRLRIVPNAFFFCYGTAAPLTPYRSHYTCNRAPTPYRQCAQTSAATTSALQPTPAAMAMLALCRAMLVAAPLQSLASVPAKERQAQYLCSLLGLRHLAPRLWCWSRARRGPRPHRFNRPCVRHLPHRAGPESGS